MKRTRLLHFFIIMLIAFFVIACDDNGNDVIQFTVTFETNDGSMIEPITINADLQFDFPVVPEKDGYIFDGWYWDNDTFLERFTLESLQDRGIVANITVYAKWLLDDSDVHTIEVTFNSMGGSEVDSVFVEPGSKVQAPSITREGFSLEGWFLSENEGETFDQKWDFDDFIVNFDLILYAKWSINQYTITFNTGGGNLVNPMTQDFETAIDHIATPEKEGYTFIGWYPEIPDNYASSRFKHYSIMANQSIHDDF
jgi:uncharacterized repeat protein (TIGR02543 family)